MNEDDMMRRYNLRLFLMGRLSPDNIPFEFSTTDLAYTLTYTDNTEYDIYRILHNAAVMGGYCFIADTNRVWPILRIDQSYRPTNHSLVADSEIIVRSEKLLYDTYEGCYNIEKWKEPKIYEAVHI